MKFTDWKVELEAAGYVVTDDLITTKRGDVLAGKDPYGGYYVSDSMVQAILSKPVKKEPVKKEIPAEKLELVRARDEDGKFVADDPATPNVNEAWTKRVKKRVTKE
jgi:hypothetical protein